ncbi:hypothetical protein ARMGADRAFT_1061943 [Armillaria gallica]|uniref:Uncharacterized protein n=1 Tax=Armillaria gallica TaxID=47427 RepID=A0A2H3DJ66_ARMGA|nr:hypothetical protein ARMGADRAFT_1061943 [Armillaria gallica]
MHPSNDQRKVLAKLCMHVASTFEIGRRKKEKPEIDGDGNCWTIYVLNQVDHLVSEVDGIIVSQGGIPRHGLFVQDRGREECDCYGTEPLLRSAAMVKPHHEYSLTASAVGTEWEKEEMLLLRTLHKISLFFDVHINQRIGFSVPGCYPNADIYTLEEPLSNLSIGYNRFPSMANQ